MAIEGDRKYHFLKDCVADVPSLDNSTVRKAKKGPTPYLILCKP